MYLVLGIVAVLGMILLAVLWKKYGSTVSGSLPASVTTGLNTASNYASSVTVKGLFTAIDLALQGLLMWLWSVNDMAKIARLGEIKAEMNAFEAEYLAPAVVASPAVVPTVEQLAEAMAAMKAEIAAERATQTATTIPAATANGA